MFTPAPYEKGKAKLVAFNPATFNIARSRSYFGDGYNITVEAIWFSKSPSTLGSMVLGTVDYFVNAAIAGENLQMDFEGFKRVARNNPNRTETLLFSSRIVLSDTKIWGAGGMGELEETEKAIQLWRSLGELPEGWDGWYAVSNRVA